MKKNVIITIIAAILAIQPIYSFDIANAETIQLKDKTEIEFKKGEIYLIKNTSEEAFSLNIFQNCNYVIYNSEGSVIKSEYSPGYGSITLKPNESARIKYLGYNTKNVLPKGVTYEKISTEVFPEKVLEKSKSYIISNNGNNDITIYTNSNNTKAKYDYVKYDFLGSYKNQVQNSSYNITLSPGEKIRLSVNFDDLSTYILNDYLNSDLSIEESVNPAFLYLNIEKGSNYEITNKGLSNTELKNADQYYNSFDVAYANSDGNVSSSYHSSSLNLDIKPLVTARISAINSDLSFYIPYEYSDKLDIKESNLPVFQTLNFVQDKSYLIKNTCNDTVKIQFNDYLNECNYAIFNSDGVCSSLDDRIIDNLTLEKGQYLKLQKLDNTTKQAYYLTMQGNRISVQEINTPALVTFKINSGNYISIKNNGTNNIQIAKATSNSNRYTLNINDKTNSYCYSALIDLNANSTATITAAYGDLIFSLPADYIKNLSAVGTYSIITPNASFGKEISNSNNISSITPSGENKTTDTPNSSPTHTYDYNNMSFIILLLGSLTSIFVIKNKSKILQ